MDFVCLFTSTKPNAGRVRVSSSDVTRLKLSFSLITIVIPVKLATDIQDLMSDGRMPLSSFSASSCCRHVTTHPVYDSIRFDEMTILGF